MVTIKAFRERANTEGKPFIALELTGDIELIQSQTTGRFYATVRRTFISPLLTNKLQKRLSEKSCLVQLSE